MSKCPVAARHPCEAGQIPVLTTSKTSKEAVRENKAHYATAEAQAALRPKNPMAGFMHSYVTSHIVSGGDGDDS